ncbi:MAG: triose-phosphate isomerase [Elusimicrobia bacterium RIFOXYA2_FULL_39_19]|nr:MAG: triose-phosphate isomerase [Elusimicrobia bacterium RIFOXYA2_FULL_39_19]
MRKPIMAGNWKMHKTIAESVDFVSKVKSNVSDVKDCEIVVCPVFTALKSVADAAKGTNVCIGAQNMHWEEKGAFTGEISPKMLLDAGCKYVIIGHSERRQYFGETNETVNKKMLSAFKHGLVPIVCIGETLAEREKNITFDVVGKQVKEGLAGLTGNQSSEVVIAYEPVWAIGTGKTASPAQAQEVHEFVRKTFTEMYGKDAAAKVRILYGGSVKPDNVSELMKQPDIDGGLVGGAALEVDSYTKLIKFQR